MNELQRIPITPEMVQRAQAKYDRNGQLKGNIFRDNSHGFLGEQMYQSIVPDAVEVDQLFCDFTLRGFRVDVKTRSFSYYPTLKDRVCVPQHSILTENKQFDFLVFMGVMKSQKDYGFLMGWVTKKQFLERSRFVQPGIKELGSHYYTVPNRIMLARDLNHHLLL